MTRPSLTSLVLSVAALAGSTMAKFQVTVGDTETCAAYDGEVKCWGHNNYGQLGLGDASDRLEPQENPIDLSTDSSGADFLADAVVCGGSHCCALSTGKELKCWGWCAAAECDGDAVGNNAGEMETLQPLSSVADVVDIAVLMYMTCVLENDGVDVELKCLGAVINGHGPPLGTISLSDVSWEVSGLGGGFYTLCAFDSATASALKCWGRVGVEEDVVEGLFIQSVRCGKYHCCALTADHSLKCWGAEASHGQTSTSQLDDFGAVLDFAVAEQSTCALSTDRKVKCFGDDASGQLGGGSFDIPSDFTESGARFAVGAPGTAHYCVYEETDELLLQCWGLNSHGQLGYGDGGNLEFVALGWDVPSPCPGDLCAAGPIEVERNNIIGSVDISNEMHFELDFTVTEWPSSGWGGLFQCGSGKKDRYPLVMVNKNSGSKGFYTWFRDGAGTSTTGGYSTVPMELGQQYHLEIDFTQSELTVSLDDVVVLQKAKGTHSVQSQVPCGVFSNNWKAATATVSNIIVADVEDDVGPSPCSGDLCAPGPIEVERNNFIGFVDLLDAMHFEFDFTVTEWPSSGWGGLLQCGSGNNDRYPLVMVQPNSNTLGFYTWFRDGEGASTTGGYSNAPLQLNQEYHLDIDFTQSELTVSLDDVVVLQKAKPTHSLQSQVPCGVFSNNFNAATATVSNLVIGPPLGSSDGSAMQSHTASGEQSAAATTEWSSSFVVGMVAVVAFGVGAMSAVALLKLKQNRQKKAATGPAHEERVPEVSMSAVPETTPKEEKRETV